jgi:hypothetical protein
MGRARWAAIGAALLLACGGGEREDGGRRAGGDPADAGASAEGGEASPEEAPGRATRRAARAKRGASAASRVRRVEGKLERATSERVVIRPAGEDPVTLRVGPGTSVTLDGRATPAESLEQGSDVRASYQNGDGRPRALSIEARSADGAGGGGARPPGGASPAHRGQGPGDAVWQRNTGERGSPGGG